MTKALMGNPNFQFVLFLTFYEHISKKLLLFVNFDQRKLMQSA